MLRFVSPVVYMRRTATRDLELREQKIRAGEKLALYYGAANRDEAVFERPDAFEIRRHPNPHLAFGGGAHFCLGAHIARIEIDAMLKELLARMTDLRLDVTAVERSRLLAVDHRDLAALLRSEPEIALALLQHLANRLIALTEQASEIANLNLRLRLARKIARLARAFGDEHKDGLWLPPRISQGDWSEFVGVTREAINKQFRAWSDEGLVRIESDGLMILDRQRLSELGNCAPL